MADNLLASAYQSPSFPETFLCSFTWKTDTHKSLRARQGVPLSFPSLQMSAQSLDALPVPSSECVRMKLEFGNWSWVLNSALWTWGTYALTNALITGTNDYPRSPSLWNVPNKLSKGFVWWFAMAFPTSWHNRKLIHTFPTDNSYIHF